MYGYQHKHVFMAADGEGSGGGEGGITPEVQKIIDEQIAAATEVAVAGLKAKNSELLGKMKDFQTRFDGIDPDVHRKFMAKFDSEEEAALMAKGDVDGIVNRRTERMQAENVKTLKERDAQLAKAEAKATKLAAGKLAGSLRDAALKAGALPEALEDIVLRAGAVWRLNDDGDPVAMNGDEIVLGKDGKTPLAPIEWAETLRETAPHLWPKAQGSNARGSGNNDAPARKGKAPVRADYTNDVEYSKAAARFHAVADE